VHPSTSDREELLRQVGAAVEALLDVVVRARAPELLAVDVTMQQAKILHLVGVDPGIGVTGLAARLGVSLSTVSGSVERLVELELIERQEDLADRRHVGITLSTAGREVVDRFRDINARTFAQLLRRLHDVELRGLLVGIPGMTRALIELEHVPDSQQEGAP
jgi:DNA-binding MarR family transcriptional regulator